MMKPRVYLGANMDINESREVLSIAEQAKKSGLKTKDALHAACAIVAKCDYLITTDTGFLKYSDSRITILNPMEFILEMEGF